MTTTALAKAGRKEWIALGVLTLTALLVSMDTMVLYFALPFISAKLQPSASQQLWIIDIYGFVLAGLLITMGSLGDRIGRRLLLLLGGGAFGLASLAAAYSHDANQLIASRALLGIAGATLAPSTMALLRNMFHDPKERKTAIGVWTGAFSGGAALGPVVGGLLLDHFWWGSVFLINAPVMLLLLVVGPFLLPEFRDPRPGRFDLVSSVLSLGAILPVVYGVQQFAQNDGLTRTAEISAAAGLLVGVVFVIRQLKLADPLIDLGLLRHRTFSASMLSNILAGSMMAGFGLFSTQYLQSVLGYRPLAAALWSLPAPLAVGVAVAIATVLSQKIRPAGVISLGFLVMAAGFGVMTRVQVHSSVLVVLVGATALAFGTGMIVALLTDMIIGTAPAERAGAAAALSETGNEIGGAVGVAFLGSIGAAIYHHQMAGSLPAAAKTLGGAQAAAARLAGGGPDLLEHARQSFVHGMHITAVVCIALMLVGAAGSTAMLRHVKSGKDQQADQAAADEQAAGAGLALANGVG